MVSLSWDTSPMWLIDQQWEIRWDRGNSCACGLLTCIHMQQLHRCLWLRVTRVGPNRSDLRLSLGSTWSIIVWHFWEDWYPFGVCLTSIVESCFDRLISTYLQLENHTLYPDTTHAIGKSHVPSLSSWSWQQEAGYEPMARVIHVSVIDLTDSTINFYDFTILIWIVYNKGALTASQMIFKMILGCINSMGVAKAWILR